MSCSLDVFFNFPEGMTELVSRFGSGLGIQLDRLTESQSPDKFAGKWASTVVWLEKHTFDSDGTANMADHEYWIEIEVNAEELEMQTAAAALLISLLPRIRVTELLLVWDTQVRMGKFIDVGVRECELVDADTKEHVCVGRLASEIYDFVSKQLAA